MPGKNILQFCVDFFPCVVHPPDFGLLLSVMVLQHYLYTADLVLSFMYRCCVVAVKRNVLQRAFSHADGAFAAVIQSHEFHPSPMHFLVQHEFNSARPLSHAAMP